MTYRTEVWNKFANEWKLAGLEANTTVISLDAVSAQLNQMLKGQLKGRTILKLV